VIAGAAALIAGGCGADGSAASTLGGTTPDLSTATTVVVPATSTAPIDPVTSTNAMTSTPSTAAPSTVLTVPLGYARGPHDVSQALETAKVLWANANIASYRLTIAEHRSNWTAGCKWNIVVADGVMTEDGVDPSSTSSTCLPIEWTVEQLHELIAYWLDTVSQFPASEFGEHTLDVQFNDIGVPVAMDYDLANGEDEESSLRVTFTATTGVRQ
jgi:hypothetical protein